MRDHTSAEHNTGGQINELTAVEQYTVHRFEIFAYEKYGDPETLVRIIR